MSLLPIELWKSALLKPKETFAKEKANASLTEGVKQIAVAAAAGGLVVGLIILVISLLGGPAGLVAGLIGVVGGVAGAVIFAVIFSLIGNGITWIIAKVLGGAGSFSTQYYVAALYTAPVILANIALGIIPVIGSLVGLLVGLYSIYLSVLMVKEVHQMSTLKAAVVVLLPAITLGILVVLGLVTLLGATSGLLF
ncbi:MAG: YIP1 family protein [Candidatus Micrarchaeia archaeon]